MQYTKMIWRILKSPFTIIGILFIVWVTFFDSSSYVNQQKQKAHMESLKDQKAFYEREIVTLDKNKELIEKDPEALEKYARENYMYKKKGEDIYVLKKTNE